MAKPLYKVTVNVRKETHLSLAELKKRVSGPPMFVRVGLPDNEDTTQANQLRKERGQTKGRRRK